MYCRWEEIDDKEYEVKWKEEYKCFEIEIIGKLKKGNILSGRFTSSLGFSGTFTLCRDDKEAGNILSSSIYVKSQSKLQHR